MKTNLKKSLDLVLLEVGFPFAKKDNEKSFKDLVVVMEQFYSGMSELQPYFVLEIVSPATENETNFYAAVPRKFVSFFEKQVYSIFPDAEIREEPTDYNVFKTKGVNLGTTISLRTKAILPVKTYEDLSANPLEVIANAFSKLNREEEGAAVQILIDPSKNVFNHDAEKAISLLNAGEPIKTSLAGGESLTKSFLKVITGGTIHSEPKPEFIDPNPLDKENRAEIIRLLEKKISKQVMSINVRLVVSAQTKNRANEILTQLKSMFSQYSSTQGNSFVTNDLKGRSLKNLFYNFSYRLFDKSKAIFLNTEELTSIFHFPSQGLFAPKTGYVKDRQTEAPPNLSKEGSLIGKNYFRGVETEIHLSPEDRRRHLYTIGQTGTGKSALLKNMAVQDIKDGRGICFIDPHGSDIQDILGQIPEERWDDVIYFDPSEVKRPFGLNMLEYDPAHPEQKTFIVNELLEIFQKLFADSPEGLGPMFQQYFRNATLLVMEDPESGNTLLEISRVLVDEEFRRLKLSKSKNVVVNNFWEESAEKAGGEAALANMAPYITSKFDTFLANEIMRPIISQEKSSFNFREVIDNQKILLVNLSKGRLGEINSSLLGMIVVGKLFMSAMARVDLAESERKDFYLYIDEFQNVTTSSISRILSEARKYRLNLTIAHQFISQIEEETRKAVFGNVGSMVVFRIGKDDAEFLSKNFELVFSEEDLMNISNYHAYAKLLVNGETSRPFNIQTIPPEKGSPEVASEVKEASAVKYGRPLSEVESEIRKKYLRGRDGENLKV
ncbi:type IV secretory system conjugative DNA transfer family protein [Patescibacteria group bacterium]